MIYQIVFSALGGFGFAIALAAILHNVWRVFGRGMTIGPPRGPNRPVAPSAREGETAAR